MVFISQKIQHLMLSSPRKLAKCIVQMFAHILQQQKLYVVQSRLLICKAAWPHSDETCKAQRSGYIVGFAAQKKYCALHFRQRIVIER